MLIGISVFFFKQKTAYDMRISDWSSDVCSSDLCFVRGRLARGGVVRAIAAHVCNLLRPLVYRCQFQSLFPVLCPVRSLVFSLPFLQIAGLQRKSNFPNRL